MKNIGIVGYGCYIPRFRIKVEEIARIWGEDPENIKNGLGIFEKSVPDMDEDTITISVAAAKNAISRCGESFDQKKIGALYIGSESHPYVVKPSGTVVAEALDLSNNLMMADFEFACKAGTAAMLVCLSHVKAGDIEYGLAIGADTSQGQPGDALEYTAAAGGGAFVIGKNPLASFEGSYSYASDTPDFWRREGQSYPKHSARFTGKPAYFKHIISATKGLMEKLELKPSDFNHVVFHMPNGKFPSRVGQMLGFTKEQMKAGFIVPYVGNFYSGSSLVGLCSVLDVAKPGERILITSFGSGAGSDSMSFIVTDEIIERREKAPLTKNYIENKKYIDYGLYVKMRRKLVLE